MGRAMMRFLVALMVVACVTCFPHNATLRVKLTSSNLTLSSSCDEGDNCWDLRMQNVEGCTSGWTLHGLWPQWQESCTQEKFDITQVKDLEDDLNKYWPSCDGPAQSFWSHEWGKHGTCSTMSQHAYFSTALNLLSQYKS